MGLLRGSRSYIERLRYHRAELVLAAVLLVLPFLEGFFPAALQVSAQFRLIFIFAILALGLNVVTGLCGLLNFGIAAFMALGAYGYAILSADIYPFQLGFWFSTLGALCIGVVAGLLIGLPTLRLRGDYLAIVTLGFGEIVQDALRNLEVITKGTQGINPLPAPAAFGFELSPQSTFAWYYFLLAMLAIVLLAAHNIERSPFGRAFLAIRDDELAARCMGVRVAHVKLLAFCCGAAFAALSGALYVSFLGSSGEPGNYDFQLSVLALCIVIIGGIGSTRGVLVGALVMLGFSSILLPAFTSLLASFGNTENTSIFASATNWKYLIFGFALILSTRFRPQGLLPAPTFHVERS